MAPKDTCISGHKPIRSDADVGVSNDQLLATRGGKVLLLLRWADTVLRNPQADPGARIAAEGIAGWLADDGRDDLVKFHLKLTGEPGCRFNARYLAKQLREGARVIDLPA